MTVTSAPQSILNLIKPCPTLRSIIHGSSEFELIELSTELSLSIVPRYASASSSDSPSRSSTSCSFLERQKRTQCPFIPQPRHFASLAGHLLRLCDGTAPQRVHLGLSPFCVFGLSLVCLLCVFWLCLCRNLTESILFSDRT